MILEYTAIITYLHFVGIIILFVSLGVELVLFQKEISHTNAKRIRLADAFYGISSVIIMSSGLLKAIEFGKGWAYYSHNWLFWSKIGAFSVIGLLSIYPTIYFFRWAKALKNGETISVSEANYSLIKKLLIIEIGIAFFVPLLAVFMARGFGFWG